MGQECTIKTRENFKNLLEEREEGLKKFMNDVIESEFKLLEFDLFLASIGKKKLDESTELVNKLRKEASEGKINLSEYEDLLDEY